MFVLRQPPFGPMRVLMKIRGKRGKLPLVDTSIPKDKGGMLTSHHDLSDSGLVFGVDEQGSPWVAINNDEKVKAIKAGDKRRFIFVLTPKHIAMLGRFLGKMAIELLCESWPEDARSLRYDQLRTYVRRGVKNDLWAVASKKACDWRELVTRVPDGVDVLETIECYEYGIFDFPEERVFAFVFGGEAWAISMERPLPLASTTSILAEESYAPRWYSRDSWRVSE